MKRTDSFWSVMQEWGRTTEYRPGDITRIARAICFEIADNLGECTLGDGIDSGFKVKGLRNVGKTGYRIYEEFVEWAKSQMEKPESQSVAVETPVAIDWEQRRYEIAKDVFVKRYLPDQPDEEDWAIREAVRLADKLIKELTK